MAYAVSGERAALIEAGLFFYTTLWIITRKDGTVFRFTDSPTEVISNATGSAELYQPHGGGMASALAQKENLKANNRELKGIFDFDRITADDIRAGLYRQATGEEHLIDSRFPNSGSLGGNKYYIQDITYMTGTNIWQAQVEGVTRFLKQRVGERYTRNCRYRFGDIRCTVNRNTGSGNWGNGSGSIKTSTSVASVSDNRTTFTASVSSVYTAAAFQYGQVSFTSGANNGMSYDIIAFDPSTNTFQTASQTAYDIAVGDSILVYTGCRKSTAACTEYSNHINFGGFPHIPGGDLATRVPEPRG